jgi:hypothetical protein
MISCRFTSITAKNAAMNLNVLFSEVKSRIARAVIAKK